MQTAFLVRRLTPAEAPQMAAMNTLFGEAFADPSSYTEARPGQAYLAELLGSDGFIALAAVKGDAVVGGLAAYELRKFERQRSEFYLYDLAVGEAHRREGIATALITELKRIAATRDGHVIFVQADYGDDPAIALYSKLGTREEVLHFDIAVP